MINTQETCNEPGNIHDKIKSNVTLRILRLFRCGSYRQLQQKPFFLAREIVCVLQPFGNVAELTTNRLFKNTGLRCFLRGKTNKGYQNILRKSRLRNALFAMKKHLQRNYRQCSVEVPLHKPNAAVNFAIKSFLKTECKKAARSTTSLL